VVGAGYIGLEMVEALRTCGIDVTLVEQLPQVLSTADPELGALVADELGAATSTSTPALPCVASSAPPPA
jgi:pyruvate/2-oxoglutarate dehydrogenase complex dihydrolipoamide dehydrogenase (E3) component